MTVNCISVRHSNTNAKGLKIAWNSWMISHLELRQDTPWKGIEEDASVILHQSILSQVGTWFHTENGFPAAILKFQAVLMKL